MEFRAKPQQNCPDLNFIRHDFPGEHGRNAAKCSEMKSYLMVERECSSMFKIDESRGPYELRQISR